MNIRCIWKGKNRLGECPVWDTEKQILYWIDIETPILHSINFKTNHYHFFEMPSPINCIVLCDNGNLLAAMQQRLVFIDLASGNIKPILSLDLPDEILFNDGKCDKYGRFWIGTRNTAFSEASAGLYLLRDESYVQLIIDNLIVANGLGWSPDNTTMYLTETISRTIQSYDFNFNAPMLTNKKIFNSFDASMGYPDGLTVDNEGFVWVAHWGAGNVTRYSPKGEINSVIPLPAKNVTSCCFGGPDLKTLFVTSANMDFDNLTDIGPMAGSVFAIDLEVGGTPQTVYTRDLSKC